jgi:hypothetical protein
MWQAYQMWTEDGATLRDLAKWYLGDAGKKSTMERKLTKIRHVMAATVAELDRGTDPVGRNE